MSDLEIPATLEGVVAELLDVDGRASGDPPEVGDWATDRQLNLLNQFGRLGLDRLQAAEAEIDQHTTGHSSVGPSLTARVAVIASDTAPLAVRNRADAVVAGADLAAQIATAAADAEVGRIHLQGSFTGATLATVTPAAGHLLVTGESDGDTSVTLADDATQWWQTTGTRTQLTGSLDADATAGTQKIVSASWAAQVAAGDRLLVASDANFAPKRAQYRKAERAVVRAVSGSEIILESALDDTYLVADTVRLHRYSSEPRVEFHHLHLHAGGGAINKLALVRLDRCAGPVATNVLVEGAQLERGLRFYDCREPYVERVWTRDIRHARRGASTPLGYGVEFYGCERGRIHNSHGMRDRHSFEVNGGSASIDLPVSRWCAITESEAERNTSAAFSSHGHSRYTRFENLTATGCAGFLVARGDQTTIKGLRGQGLHSNEDPAVADDPSINSPFPGYGAAIWIGEAAQDGPASSDWVGNAATGLVIEDVNVDAGLEPHRVVPSGENQTVQVIDCFEPLVDARIVGVNARQFTGGMRFRGQTVNRARIRGGVLHCEQMHTTPRAIDVNPSEAAGAGFDGHRVKDLDIDAVTFVGPAHPCIRVYGNSAATAANLSTAVTVRRCTNRQGSAGAARPLVHLAAGHYGRVTVADNDSDSTKAAVVTNDSTAVAALTVKGNYGSDGFDVAP